MKKILYLFTLLLASSFIFSVSIASASVQNAEKLSTDNAQSRSSILRTPTIFMTSGSSVSLPLPNAATYTLIPSYDGSNQVIHPDVIYIPSGFGGYKYWMSFTPFYQWDSDYENPSLVASNDGKNWIAPNKLKAPLVSKPTGDWAFNADPDVVYNSITNQLYVYYHWINSDQTEMHYMVLKVNSDMSLETPIEYDVSSDIGQLPISESVLKISNNLWYMWSVKGGTTSFRTSKDGINWGNQVKCDLVPELNPWHIDVEHIPDGTFLMTIYDFNGSVYLATSKDSTPTSFSMSTQPVIVPSGDSKWDGSSLYRTSSLYDSNTGEITFYYSGVYEDENQNNYPHIGQISVNYASLIQALNLASTNANLSSLTISSGTLSPAFTSSTLTYTTSVLNSVSSVTVTPTTQDSAATITVNGTTVVSGQVSQPVTLAVGPNVVNVNVTAQDGTLKTYTITVTRATNGFPIANFTANVTSGYAPLSVQFNDSSKNANGWYWDFGDGANSTRQNTTHVYSTVGNFTVNLTARNANGIDMKSAIINVTLPPFPGYTNPPTDPNHDGLYEDINGNSHIEFDDVVAYYKNMNWITQKNLTAYFDYNKNGQIDFDDVVKLYDMI